MTIKMAKCRCCKKPFPLEEGKEWARDCTVCWKTEKAYKMTLSDNAFSSMQDAYVALEERVKLLEEEVDSLKGPKAKANRSFKGKTIDEEKIKALIRLCHPDRHGNNELSNEVTKWLLSLR